MLRRRRLFLAAGLAVLALGFPAVARTARAGVLDPCAGTDWPMFGHDLGRSFASPDTCINNVSALTLVPRWFFNTNSPVTGQPAVVAGTVYAGAFNGSFYALDAATGQQKWGFQLAGLDAEKTDYGAFPGSPTVASVGGHQMVVVGGGDTLLVLDAATGQRLASQCLDRVDPTCHGRSGIVSEIESSPAVVPWSPGASWAEGDDLVVVGQDANEADPSGVQGIVGLTLSPAGVLTPLWQFDPESGTVFAGLAPVETGGPTGHGCGDVWSSPTIDVASRTVVFGGGNCNHPTAPTQNESTYAINLDTGALKWQASPLPYTSQMDLDFGATPNLLGNGLVGEGGKNGVYYTYPIGAAPAAPPGPPSAWHTTVATASSIGGIIPSTAVGQVATLSGAIHPAIFVASAIPLDTSNLEASLLNDLLNPGQALGVHAIDAVTHQVIWNAISAPAFGAVVYDNGVVYAPDTLTDSLLVLDANSGLPLRIMPLNAPPSSPVAISGDTVYEGAGTTESTPPFSDLGGLGGIWAFQTVV
jgi:outer membrane protein assembly factor BamB